MAAGYHSSERVDTGVRFKAVLTEAHGTIMQPPQVDGAQSHPPSIILFVLHSRPKAEEGKIVQERPFRSTPPPSSVAFHRSQIAVLRVELRRARSENPEAVAEILVALDQELEALAQARMAAQSGELHPGPWPKSS